MTPNSPWRTLRSLIPNTIPYYPTREEYEGNQGVGTGAPVDNSKPYKAWRDNSAWYPGSYWFGGPATAMYRTFSIDAGSGALKLHAIDSPDFLDTYSDAVIRTYREYRHLFKNGVPTLTSMVLDRKTASEFNYGFNGNFTPPPAEIATNIMLAPGPDGEWMAIDYQAWIQIQRKASQMTDEQRVARVIDIGLGTGTAKDKVSAMRVALQDTPNTGGVL